MSKKSILDIDDQGLRFVKAKEEQKSSSFDFRLNLILADHLLSLSITNGYHQNNFLKDSGLIGILEMASKRI